MRSAPIIAASGSETEDMMTRADRLKIYAEAATFIFGSRWQSDAARHHGVSIRTMQRWVALEQEIPDGVVTEIVELLIERAKEQLDLVDRIRASAVNPDADKTD